MSRQRLGGHYVLRKHGTCEGLSLALPLRASVTSAFIYIYISLSLSLSLSLSVSLSISFGRLYSKWPTLGRPSLTAILSVAVKDPAKRLCIENGHIGVVGNDWLTKRFHGLRQCLQHIKGTTFILATKCCSKDDKRWLEIWNVLGTC